MYRFIYFRQLADSRLVHTLVPSNMGLFTLEVTHKLSFQKEIEIFTQSPQSEMMTMVVHPRSCQPLPSNVKCVKHSSRSYFDQIQVWCAIVFRTSEWATNYLPLFVFRCHKHAVYLVLFTTESRGMSLATLSTGLVKCFISTINLAPNFPHPP